MNTLYPGSTDAEQQTAISRMLALLENDQPGVESLPQLVPTQTLTRKVPIFKWPVPTTERQKKAVLICLTSCGRAPESENSAWQTFVLSYTCLAVPEMVGLIENERPRDYEFVELSREFINQCTEAVEMHMGETPPTENPMILYPHQLPNASMFPVTADLVECATTEGIYGYLSLLLFLVGKSITNENRVSITTRRPRALENRFGSGAAWILSGEGRIADENHSRIHGAWTRSTRPRIVIIKQFAATMTQSSMTLPFEIISVNFHLMKWSNAAYVAHIAQLLAANPWAATIPQLITSIRHYQQSILQLAAQPAWFRPYFKLAYQDSTQLFLRRILNPAISVAVLWHRQQNNTMQNFAVDANSKPTVDAFVREATRRGMIVVPVTEQATVSDAT